MKYFIDTEFLEGTQTKRFLGFPVGKTKPTIDLISIGIVAEDGREYYAISKDFNLKEAWNRWQFKNVKCASGYWDNEKDALYRKNSNILIKKEYWIRENVLKPIHEDLCKQVGIYGKTYHSDLFTAFTYKSMKRLIKWYGKTNKQIAEEIKQFTQYEFYKVDNTLQSDSVVSAAILNGRYNPQFYAHYADYDWVAFCWLFGNMDNLPKGFPMYCIDLKQELDRKLNNIVLPFKGYYPNPNDNLSTKLREIKAYSNYPQEINKHHALIEARWNKQLYQFLKNLKYEYTRK